MDSPVVEDFAPSNALLGGRYRLHSLLGAGGMARVYDGWDERLARPVAVKLLRSDLAAVADLRRRFELEARAAARLTHPHVVAVYDAGEDNGQSYIVMERLRGESLADSIGRGPLDVAWLRRLAGEVLSALGAAHGAGIIHRDIKPGNILLGPDGRAKVSDFGIASVVEVPAGAETAAALTGAGLVVGTPAYLAPERAMGHPATVRSDLYALGVVLYEALTGRKPYSGVTPAAIAAAAVNGAAENPLLLRPDADPELVAVIGRAMALDPAQRYASAAEMASDLLRATPPPTSVMAAAPASAALAPTEAAVAATPTEVATPGRRPGAGPPARPGAPRRGRSPFDRRRGLVALGIGAVAVVALALLVVSPGFGGRGASSSTTGAPATTAPPSPRGGTTSRPTTAITTPATVGGGQSDPVAVALQAVARNLARSKSAAAGQLASGLSTVATIADPASRAAAASALLDQTVQWYQQGQLTSGEYATAGAVLHMAGAPQAPPPTVKHQGKPGGGGGGGD